MVENKCLIYLFTKFSYVFDLYPEYTALSSIDLSSEWLDANN